MFPSYSETDFNDFKNQGLEQKSCHKNIPQKEDKRRTVQIVTQEDISLVYKWHSNIVRNLTYAEWLEKVKKIPTANFIEPLIQRYPIFSRVMENAWEALDADFEGKISPSLLLLISNIKKKISGDGKIYFFVCFLSVCMLCGKNKDVFSP